MPSHTLLSHDLRGIRIDIEPLLYPDHTKEPRPLVLTTDNREMPPPARQRIKAREGRRQSSGPECTSRDTR